MNTSIPPSPNKPTAPNPAIASRWHAGHLWRGVGEPGRSAAEHHDENMNATIKHLILIGVCASLLSGCCAPRSSGTTATIWEYQIVDARLFIELQNAINKRAADGWELVSVHPPPPDSALSYAVMRRAKK